jgi:hypothetical protein
MVLVTALCVLLVLAVSLVLVVSETWRKRRRSVSLDPRQYQVRVDLHTIRRRFDLALFKLHLERDMAEARRRLEAELAELDRWGR